MKIGILGGSFDPIHNGHLAMAEAAQEAHGLDRVLFLPAGRPPHKRGPMAHPAHRLRMVELAIQGRDGFVASDLEITRPGGVTYTVDTLEEIHRENPEAELFFILGADSVPEFPGWRRPHRILELARIVAINRPGFPLNHPGSQAAFDPKDYGGFSPEVLERLQNDAVHMPPSPLESRAIRRKVREGKSLRGAVAPAVAGYIASKGLYKEPPGQP
jgi:nicotinate-nucleotide adenylyltransferase